MLSLKKTLMLLTFVTAIALMPVSRARAADQPEHAQGVAAGTEHAEPADEGKEATLSALWALIIFIVMLAILYPTAWRSIVLGLKKREERIRKDIEDAEKARAQAEATLKESTAKLAAAEAKTRELVAVATTQGEQLAANIRTQAQKEAEMIRQRSVQDIEAARDAALRDVHNQAALLSTAVAEKIVRRNLNDTDQEQLIRESLEQFQQV
jgi:F-type H+-transporting ATPase subunit b